MATEGIGPDAFVTVKMSRELVAELREWSKPTQLRVTEYGGEYVLESRRNDRKWTINNDDSGHWYVMWHEDLPAFERWVYEEGPEPASLRRLGGHPNHLTFENPADFGEPL